MQVTFETLVRRAAAEGYTLSKVKIALRRLEQEAREKAIRAALEGWHGCEKVEPDVVADSLTSVRYVGGFIYPGHDVSPNEFQERRHSRLGSSKEADHIGAADWVRTAPIGAEVTVEINFGNKKSSETFTRVQGGWARTHRWDETYVALAAEGPCLYNGIRADTARAVNVGMGSTFHQLFDLVVEQLFD